MARNWNVAHAKKMLLHTLEWQARSPLLLGPHISLK